MSRGVWRVHGRAWARGPAGGGLRVEGECASWVPGCASIRVPVWSTWFCVSLGRSQRAARRSAARSGSPIILTFVRVTYWQEVIYLEEIKSSF